MFNVATGSRRAGRGAAALVAFTLGCGGLVAGPTAVAAEVASPMETGTASVTLRSSIARPVGRGLLVGDVAEVAGDAGLAGRVSALAVAVGGKGASEASVDVAEVRRAIDAAGAGLSARVMIRGTRCMVSDGEAVPRAGVPITPEPRSEGDFADRLDPTSLRGRVALRLAELYRVEPGDMRLKIVPTGKTQSDALDAPPMGSRVEVLPGGGVQSGRLPVRVDEYSGDRLVRTLTCSAELAVRRDVLVARVGLDRERVIAADDLVIEERWVSPTEDAAPPAEQVVGLAPKRRIEPGRPVVAADVQSEVVAERGDQVWVHYLGERVTIKARGRTLERGRDGELVRVQLEGSRSAIRARMSGRGNAVVRAEDATTPEPLRAGGAAPSSKPMGRPGRAELRPPVREGPVIERPAAAPAMPAEPGDGLTVSERAKRFTPPPRK